MANIDSNMVEIDGRSGGDVGDAAGQPNFFPSARVARMPVDRNAMYYNMAHRKRGLAIIFNHEYFEMSTLRQRTGTNVDCSNLKHTLLDLGFEVVVYCDKRAKEISNIVKDAAAKDHTECDCFVMAILSHGEMGILHAKDTPYKPESLWLPFTADKCPTLAGKPKLFFLQACQGDKLDAGITLHRTETDSGEHSYKIPTHADFLIAYSTVPAFFQDSEEIKGSVTHDKCCVPIEKNENVQESSYDSSEGKSDAERDGKQVSSQSFYSWRNTTNGSWFMQALCCELRARGTEFDILTLLTFVMQRVALDFESNTPNDSKMHQQKQIPCVTTMLTRLLQFTRK